MSVQPTTRAGYRESIRPHSWRQRIEYEPPGSSGAEKFTRSREPMRFAGTASGLALSPYSVASPHGVGYGHQDTDDEFQVFSDRPQSHTNNWGPVQGYF
jgi:hypothetical protein|tara:strand:+ start:239 stop:535 length:297 start_codon:yes stop_codon:yes gene_type:complete